MTSLINEQKSLDEAASKLLSFALASGADDAEVCASYGHRTKIALEKQDYHLASIDEGYQLGVRVIRSGRQGFASCNTTDAQELKEIALRAIEIAGFSPPNPNYSILASTNIPRDAPSPIWDENVCHLSLQTQKVWTKMMVDEAVRDARFRLNEGSLGTTASLLLVINSKGTQKFDRDASIYWSLMGMAVNDERITSFDFFSNLSREMSETPEKIIATTRNFSDQIVGNLKQGPSKSYNGVVVFSPRAVCEIFLSAFAYHLSGRNLAEKTSRWNISESGKLVFDSRLTLRDSPWQTDRSGFGLFDREGIPTSNRELIARGKLNQWLLDTYSGNALGLNSSGNAGGGPTSPPSVSAHTLVLAAGNEKRVDLFKRLSSEQKEFLLVHRYSGQTDPVTGDFSGVAKGGEWWHEGEKRHYVKETLISGNIFDILKKGVFGITQETEVVDSSDESPTLILDGVSVTSA